jgi:hypoxanthine phosphoribosyltransferase
MPSLGAVRYVLELRKKAKELGVSWNVVEVLSRNLAREVRRSDFKPDLIVGIAKGGLIPATLVAKYLHLPITSILIQSYTGKDKRKHPEIEIDIPEDLDAFRVLIVDDIVDSGETMQLAKEHLSFLDVKTAALYYKPNRVHTPDFYRVQTDKWIKFPWEVTY